MAAPLPLILLPPSEGKAEGGDGPKWSRGSMAIDLDAQRAKVMRALASAAKGSEADRKKLLDVTGTALSRATAADASIAKAPTLPAIERYTGVLYDALGYRTLTATERGRLDRCAVIVSGLWGLVMPSDPIPDYRLKMGAALASLGKLSTWWREPLSGALTDYAGKRPIWNLLPNEHDAAWNPPTGREQWTVRFLDRRADGSLTTVSHDNKSLKGALVRFLVANPGTTPSTLSKWRHPAGYRYAPKATEERGDTLLLSVIRG